MKHKLIVTLVASALELYAATVAAQTNPASCFLAGTSKSANASTPVTAGPLNPVTGFPEYVTDSTGLSTQRCLDTAWCFFDPIVENDPFSLQIGSGGEAFYWAADVILNNQAGAAVFKLVLAAETAFLGENPVTGGPLDGTQLPFLRLRYVFDAPADGTYTLSHPYGQEQFTVTGATGNRDIFTTYDRGLVANQAITGNVGPFMVSEPFVNVATSPEPNYLGNGGDVAVAARAVGAPCFTDAEGFNTVTLTGVDTLGNPIDFGGGQTALSTDLFVVQGRRFDGRVQTPVNASRLTYSRSAAADGKIDAFAASTTDATVTIVDGPTIPVGSGRIASPVTLDHDNLTAADQTAATGVNSTTVAVADASALPPVISLTASDTVSTYVNAAGATVQKFDPTTKNEKLVDFVDIAQADFDPSTNTLTVAAISGDKRANPVLTVRGLGTIDPVSSMLSLTTAAPPASVYVDSAAGGSSVAQVRVVQAVAPAAPTVPTIGVATARTLVLGWTDNASNETGFRIYTVAADNTRTLVGTAPVNATSATVSGLAVATSYTFVVEAFNGVGQASSETVTGSTLALPAAPATASFAMSESVQRRLDVTWDASADATDYQVYRRTGTGAYALLGTTTSTSYADLNGAANTTYTYQVVARRTIGTVTDVSATPTTTTSVTTVATPSSPLLGTVAASGADIVVNWTDRSSNEWGFQVFRRQGTGAFAAVGPFHAATAGNANLRSWTDTAVAGGTYSYRVDVSNWAGTLSSAISANVAIATLAAPTNLSTVINSRPTVNWTDNSVNETAYRLLRRTQTVNATTGLMTAGGATTRNAAANAQSYREPTALANNLTLSYEVMAMNGTTAGTSASAYVLTTALPTAARPLAAANGAGSIRLTWTASTVATVGGYEIQRCAGVACTNFAKVTGTAVNTLGTVDGRATNVFIDTGLTSGTSYTYRLRTVGGSGTTYVGGTFGATRTLVAP